MADTQRLSQRAADFRATFTCPPGARVLKHLARYCRAGETTFVAGDSHASAYGEGARTVFLWITKQMRATPEEIDTALADMED